jgi:hypothetical protein
VIADDIIEAVRSRFDVQLTRARAPRAPRAKAPTPSEAYREYLRGRHQWNKWTASGFRASVDAFARAIDLDPSFALAHAGLADAYGAMAYYAHMPAADALPLARHAAHRAVELDPQLAAHANSHAACSSADWVEAERRLTQAIASTTAASRRAYYSLFLTCRGGVRGATPRGRPGSNSLLVTGVADR